MVKLSERGVEGRCLQVVAQLKKHPVVASAVPLVLLVWWLSQIVGAIEDAQRLGIVIVGIAKFFSSGLPSLAFLILLIILVLYVLQDFWVPTWKNAWGGVFKQLRLSGGCIVEGDHASSGPVFVIQCAAMTDCEIDRYIRWAQNVHGATLVQWSGTRLVLQAPSDYSMNKIIDLQYAYNIHKENES